MVEKIANFFKNFKIKNMGLTSSEITNLKDTDEIKITSGNKEFHIHWGTLKSLIAAQVQDANAVNTLADLLALIQGEAGYWFVGNDNGVTAQVAFSCPVYFVNTIKAEALPSYADTGTAEADNTLATGQFYQIGGAVYQKQS